MERPFNSLQIHIPNGRRRLEPVERLQRLAKERDCSASCLALEAIFAYLKREDEDVSAKGKGVTVKVRGEIVDVPRRLVGMRIAEALAEIARHASMPAPEKRQVYLNGNKVKRGTNPELKPGAMIEICLLPETAAADGNCQDSWRVVSRERRGKSARPERFNGSSDGTNK